MGRIANERIAKYRKTHLPILGVDRFVQAGNFGVPAIDSPMGRVGMTPNAVHDVIYDELCLGKMVVESKNTFLHILRRLEMQRVEGIILGCTEISLLVEPGDVERPFFDTTAIHARKAVERALA